jgi:hypothetical protein
LFGPRHVVDSEARRELAELRAELTKAMSVVRQLDTEQAAMHADVKRWMRRAVAAERAAERNQGPHANGHGPVPPVTPASPTLHELDPPPVSRLTLRGARARIAARRQIEAHAALLRRVQGETPALPAADAPLPDATPETEA